LNAIYQLFANVIDFFNGYVGSYAWSIVIVTVIFRLCLLPLDIKQRTSMRKQTALQGEIAKINAKYKNDKEKASQKTMQLYKEHGVSPFAGCLPALIQLPLFLAFFGGLRLIAESQSYALYEAMKTTGEATVQSWLWVHNMWQPDTFWASVIPTFDAVKLYADFANVTDYETVMAPLVEQFTGFKNGYLILPLLAGGSSLLQSHITTPKKDPKAPQEQGMMNSAMMKYMFPIMSVWICCTSNAIFSLYWLTSNVVSILTYLVMDQVYKIKEAKAAKNENTALEG